MINIIKSLNNIYKKYITNDDNTVEKSFIAIYNNNNNNKIINYKEGYLSDSKFFIWRKHKKYKEIKKIIGDGKLKSSPCFLESINERNYTSNTKK